MTHTLDDIGHHWEGDTLVLEFVVWDGEVDTTRKDITNATIEWWLLDNGTTVLSDADAAVSITITDATNGEFEVALATGATDGLGTNIYSERVRVTDASDRQGTFGASFVVEDPTV